MDRINFSEVLRTSKRPLILDGAMGSLIQQRGEIIDRNIWTTETNLKNPELILNIHEEYIKSGCDIITSNTFRTNPIALERGNANFDIENIVRRSMELSKRAAIEYDKVLAGSNAPAEDCYQSVRTLPLAKLVDNHKKHIDLLYSSGADFILNETQSHYDEIKIICDHCCKEKIPYCISLFFTDELKLLSGEFVSDIIDHIKSYDPIAILFNCIDNNSFLNLIDNLDLNFTWGFYLNCGHGNLSDKNIECGIDAETYSQIVKSSLPLKPDIIGSCCGSTPDHTNGIKKLLNETFKS